METPGAQSGLIVEIPCVEPIVAPYRDALDASAHLGVPAHVTVLVPFAPVELIDAQLLEALRNLFAGVPGFEYVFDRTEWFGDSVLWLAPRDASPFRALTRLVFDAYPDYPPYEGVFDDVVPHATIGHGHPLEVLRAAETQVRTGLPVTGRADAVTLMTQSAPTEHWEKLAHFALA